MILLEHTWALTQARMWEQQWFGQRLLVHHRGEALVDGDPPPLWVHFVHAGSGRRRCWPARRRLALIPTAAVPLLFALHITSLSTLLKTRPAAAFRSADDPTAQVTRAGSATSIT